MRGTMGLRWWSMRFRGRGDEEERIVLVLEAIVTTQTGGLHHILHRPDRAEPYKIEILQYV